MSDFCYTPESSHYHRRAGKCVEPSAYDLENFQNTYLGNPYHRHQKFFAVNTDDIYMLLYWTSKNKSGEERVCTATLWSVTTTWQDLLIEATPELKEEMHKQAGIHHHEMANDELITIIENPGLVRMLKEANMDQIIHAFTTNDVAAFDSFTFTNTTGTSKTAKSRCVEHAVMCIAKSRINWEQVVKSEAVDLHVTALTTTFAQPHILRAIVDGKSDDSRLEDDTPKHLSTEDKREWKFRHLKAVRDEIKALEPEAFKHRYLKWLDLNFKVDPMSTPSTFKKIGRSLLFDQRGVKTWDKMAGLLFLLATSQVMKESFNSHIALAIDPKALIAEITPDDAKYGIVPPDGKNLGIVQTPEGMHWFVGLLKTHLPPQDDFISELSQILLTFKIDSDKKAFTMLTDGLAEYKHGLLGLVKRIYLNVVHGNIELTSGLKTRIYESLDPYTKNHEEDATNSNLDWEFEMPRKMRIDADSRDPIVLFSGLGLESA